MHPAAAALVDDLQAYADPAAVPGRARFFKSGPGEYGEGDVFIGATVPQVRAVLKRHRELPLNALDDLLASEIHEHRLAAALGYARAYADAARSGEELAMHDVYEHYLAQSTRLNNWDLVDCSAEHVVGPHLDVVGTAILDELAASPLLWERRIAMLATFHRIKRGESADALHVAELLLRDPEPLIHKATGWMLREVGKRVDESHLTAFLDAHARGMPAVMLSYATERLTPEQRAHYRRLRTS
ncbi:MAG: DNA alkylation repair protein [Solirubrobacteraceae bacterium]|nr:DNA alkylation repair protein [Solirubrobacteraceae bacterium]